MCAGQPNQTLPAIQDLPDLAVVIDFATMRILDINDLGLSMLGFERRDVVGFPARRFIGTVSPDLLSELAEQALGGEVVHFDREVIDANGNPRMFHFAANHADKYGLATAIVLGREFDPATKSHSQLADLIKLADLTDDIFMVFDRKGNVRYFNKVATRIHGERLEIGVHVTDLFDPGERDNYDQLLRACHSPDGRSEGRINVTGADGERKTLGVRVVFDRVSDRWFAVERDITETVRNEAQLEHQANTDSLTGVANRIAFIDRVETALKGPDRFSVLWLDMDNFKSVNDTLGHAAGDRFLICIANRLRQSVKDTDMVARFGGDEFVVLLEGIDGAEAETVAARAIDRVGQPYDIGGVELYRSCSIGVASRSPGDNLDAILLRADRAAYQAKNGGRGRFAAFHGEADAVSSAGRFVDGYGDEIGRDRYDNGPTDAL